MEGIVMQAVILAGGLGTRLRPLTYDIPKVLVPISGKPFLHYVIALLAENNINDIIICAGHLGEQIEKNVGDGSRFRCSIKYSYEEQLLDTGGAIKNAERLLAEEFFVLNGDTYHPLNYAELIDYWNKRKARYDALIVGYKNKETIVPNNMRVDKNGNVEEYVKKELADGNCVDSGIQIFKKVVFKDVPSNTRVSLEKAIFVSVIKRKRMLSYITAIRYYDMGTPERMKVFEEYLRTRRA